MDLKKIAEGIDKLVDERVRYLAISIYNDASMNTPWDTGRLRGSWRISRGSMEPTEDSSTGQEVESVEVNAQILNSGNPYETVYIYNVANYAKYVERDNSMLRNAVFKAINKKS